MSLIRARMMTTNHTLAATSVSASPTPDAGYPAENLLDPDRTKICRVTATSATFTFTGLGSPWAHALMMTGLGWSVTAQFRLLGDDTPDWNDPAYDSGWQNAYPAAMPFGAGLLGEWAMGGYITPAQAPYYRPILPFYFGGLKTYDNYRLTISDPDGDGKISLGVAAICRMIQLKRNPTTGWSAESVDTTEIRESTAGAPKVARPGTRFDRLKMSFRNVPDEDWPAIHTELKSLGKGTPWFFALRPEAGGADEAFLTLYGTAENYSGFRNDGPNRNSFNLTFAETP